MTVARGPLAGVVGLMWLVAACAGGPTAPALPAAFVLSAGLHTLEIRVWHPTHTNPYGFSSSQLVCEGSGAVSSTSLPVTVSHQGASWVVRAETGDLVLTLADASGGHKGTMGGSATAPIGGVTVTVNDGGYGPAVLPEGAASAANIGGRIEGKVRFAQGEAEKSCSANAWILSRR